MNNLPEFYMPFQAHVNPHLDVLLRDPEAWPRATGMLAGGEHPADWVIWKNESAFRAIATPELAAYCLPSAPEHEVLLIHEAMIWYFTFDDHFTYEYKLAGDTAGARAHAERLPAFMPLTPDEPVPHPTNAVEEGLADLWPRLSRSRSARWRYDWKEGITRFVNGAVMELAHIGERRTLDLIEYSQFRRETFGAYTAPCLVDMSTGASIPERIRDGREISVLLNAFMDYMSLSNDIFSYPREINEEGEVNNLVLVISNLLDTDLQQSSQVANNLVSDRLRQFEYTARKELPEAAEKYCLNKSERYELTTWIEGAEDYLAGLLAWQIKSPRY